MTNTHTGFEPLRDEAAALRRAGLSRRQIRDRLHIHNNDLLNRLLDGVPVPEWTKRPNAKDDLRARARELRSQGMTYDQIQLELGCSKSSISLWVRDLPTPERRRTPEEASAIARRGWEATLRRREEERRATKQRAAGSGQRAAEEIGGLSDRELLIAGAALYWAEGGKSKPHAPRERVTFINSDPNMIRVYLARLGLLGVERDRLEFRVSIHESADVPGAERFWAELVGIDAAELHKTTLKKHNPSTVRKNVGDDYHGCLTVRVARGADLYRRIEGWWYGIVGGVRDPRERKRT
ncbi:hypothetical protein [Streptomyces sp. CA-132043]|uniref:hypothetical protein n=1 Tax=Streptomyces sp. CA-132043 TaxID=3240048 RepID=UPI003D8EC5F6